jgi:hypothetical protein
MKETMEMQLDDFKKRYLEPFRKEVEDGSFEKIDYSTWRIWNKSLDASQWVSIYYGEHCVEITIDDMTWTFSDWDHSFGSFMKLPDTILGKAHIDEMKEIMKNIENKENGNMKNMINFDFGPCTGNDNIRMSIYGIAVKNANGTFVSYDATNTAIMDVDVFNFDGAKFLYKMPVAIKDVAVGDVVIHSRKPMFVTEVLVKSKSLKVIDPVNGEVKEIMLTRSPFGFDFATKIVNFLGNMGSANADNPFGNLWMIMLMNENDSMDNLLPLMMMNQGGGNIDPMMMFALMGNKGDNSLLPFLMMSNMNKNTGCTCGSQCGSAE